MIEEWKHIPRPQRTCVLAALKIALTYRREDFSKQEFLDFCEETWDFIESNDNEKINEFLMSRMYEDVLEKFQE